MSFPVGAEINGYRVVEQLVTSSAGWIGFAEKAGRQYQMKALSEPKYPHDEVRGSAASKESRRQAFARYFDDWRRKVELMSRLDSEGIIVPVTDVYRARAPKGPADLVFLMSPRVSLVNIAHFSLAPEDKFIFMLAATYGLADFHDLGLVHSDIKARNVPVHRTPLGRHSAKLLDFDGSYFQSSPPSGGCAHDQKYVAPEVVAYENGLSGRDVLGSHVDVFSLGVLFAEMWAGPWHLATGSDRYPCEVVSDGTFDVATWLRKAPALPSYIADVVAGMLGSDYRKRPSAREAHELLRGIRKGTLGLPLGSKIKYGRGFARQTSSTAPAIEPTRPGSGEEKKGASPIRINMKKPGMGGDR